MRCNNFVINLHKKFTYWKAPVFVLSFVMSFSIMTTSVYATDLDSILSAGVTKAMSDDALPSAGASAVSDTKDTDTKAIVISKGNTSDKAKADVKGKEESENKTAENDNKNAEEDDPIASMYGDKLVMANVENSVNIRKEANEEADIVGKLYKDCAGTIIEKGDKWTKLETGGVSGWVSNDYLFFGDKAKELAEKTGSLVATVTTETLRIRSEESADSAVYGLLAEGEKIEAIEQGDEWVKVRYSDDTQGYVSAEYVTLKYEIDEGESIEDIRAREEAEAAAKKAKEEAAKKAKVEASRTKTTTKTQGSAVDSSVSDTVLLAALIDCEAGTQPYDGKLAVGAVVVNRAKGRYGSIYNAVYAPGQFGPASSGKVAAAVARGPSAASMQAASEALSGVSNVGTATHFRNTSSGYGGIVIGNHVFW